MASNSLNFLFGEDSTESHISNDSCQGQSVAELMANLENENSHYAEEREPDAQQTATTSANQDVMRVPGEVWKSMTVNQRKSFLKKKKKMLAAAKPEPQGDDRKRSRESNSTTSPRNLEKRPRMDYSAAASCIKVAVVHKDYPLQKIEDKVFHDLLSHLTMVEIPKLSSDQGAMGFCGFSLREGGLVVNCLDGRSKEWFVGRIAALSPWQGAPIKVCDPNELEGFKRIGAFIPLPCGGIKEILHNIQVQNQGLQTHRWRVMGHKRSDKGVYMAASIPESVAKRMEAAGLKFNHGFFQIHARLFPEKKEAPTQAEPSKEEAATVEQVDSGRMEVVAEEGEAGPTRAVTAAEPLPGQSTPGAVLSVPGRQRIGGGGRGGSAGGRRATGPSEPKLVLPSPSGGEAKPPPPLGKGPPKSP